MRSRNATAVAIAVLGLAAAAWPRAATSTSPSVQARFVVQSDGKLVSYDENGAPRRASSTGGRGAVCGSQNDGNLVIYDGSTPLWAGPTQR